MPWPRAAACRLPCALFVLAATCLLGGLAGCGGDGPFQYVPVTGKLSYEDGTPIPAGGIRLQFIAEGIEAIDGANPRPARAQVNSSGEFDAVTSYKFGDGLIPGKHRVVIDMAVDAKGKLLVPEEYTRITATPLVIDTADAPLDMRVPRP